VTALGILGSGPLVEVDETGTLQPLDAAWTLRWWVAGEDRWHRADRDPAVRQRQIDDLPLVETSVRVPSGDAVAVAYGFAGVGGAPLVVTRLTNESPVPIAAAVVVGPARSIELVDDVVHVDGRPAFALGRRPAASVAADDLDGLAERVATAGGLTGGAMAGFAAFVAPLPHTQAAHAIVLPGGEDARPAAIPPPEQVASGWEAQIDRGARVSIPSPGVEALRRGRARLVMGPGLDPTLGEVAERLASALRLGWFEDAVQPTEWLIAAQRGRGGFGDDATTLACVSALAAWRVAGVPGDRLEHVVGPIAAGAHRLRRRRSKVDAPTAAAIDAAIREAAWCLEWADQRDAARDLLDGLPPSSDPPATSGRDDVVAILDGVARATDDGIELLAGWGPGWLGAPVEVVDLPTRWGRASFAVRWHGARPALLWEVTPWSDLDAATPTLTAPLVDPAWSTRSLSGDALLAAPGAPGASDAAPGTTDVAPPASTEAAAPTDEGGFT
jgi:hypothetical protein